MATMPLQTSLSSDNFKKFKPLLCPPVAELQRLSRNVIRCLPLSRLPSTLPVKDKNSKPLRLHQFLHQYKCENIAKPSTGSGHMLITCCPDKVALDENSCMLIVSLSNYYSRLSTHWLNSRVEMATSAIL